MMPLRLMLLLLLVAIVAPSAAGRSVEERDQIFQKFSHESHARPTERVGVTCISCHPVGAAIAVEPPGWLPHDALIPRESVCHECHAPGEGDLGGGDGMSSAPHHCGTCHETVDKPASHAVGWMDMHGDAAREGTAACLNCHTRSTCTDCHDRRQTAGQKIHDRSWLTVHGIAVRADPAACDTCHVQAECTSCHASQGGWGRNP